MRICVLGHRGMLGHVVCRYLTESGHRIMTVSERFNPQADPKSFVQRINALNAKWCVNCIGIRPDAKVSPTVIDTVNHRLPAACSQYLSPRCGLVHASSDGVFSPLSGNCLWDSPPNADDPYGRSKRFAESSLKRTNDYLIRCSIVGPELASRHGLFSWLASQTGTVDGFTNHSWNGITSLEWAKCCLAILQSKATTKPTIIQPATMPVISKFDLLRLITDQWKFPLSIRPVSSPTTIIRPLIPNIAPSSIMTLLAELEIWYDHIPACSPNKKHPIIIESD